MNTCDRSRFGQVFSMSRVGKGSLWIIGYVHIVFQVFFPSSTLLWYKVDTSEVFSTSCLFQEF